MLKRDFQPPALRGGLTQQSRRLAVAGLGGRRVIGSSHDNYGLDEYDDDDLDFIDDGPLDDDGTSQQKNNWKTALRGITGYDPALYMDKDEGEACESSWTQQEQEEIRSSRIAAVEDAIELKKLQVCLQV